LGRRRQDGSTVDGGSGVAHWLTEYGGQVSAARQDYHIALVRAFRGAARSGRSLASCTKLSVMAKKRRPGNKVPDTCL
jgi:hypothetical protein